MGHNEVEVKTHPQRSYAVGDMFAVQGIGVCILACVSNTQMDRPRDFVSMVCLSEGTQIGAGREVAQLMNVPRSVIVELTRDAGWSRIPDGAKYTLRVGEDR